MSVSATARQQGLSPTADKTATGLTAISSL